MTPEFLDLGEQTPDGVVYKAFDFLKMLGLTTPMRTQTYISGADRNGLHIALDFEGWLHVYFNRERIDVQLRTFGFTNMHDAELTPEEQRVIKQTIVKVML